MNNELDQTPATPSPQKSPPLKLIVGGLMLFLLVVGSGAALYLSQTTQDLRQRATGCTYWNGDPATEGSCDNRGGIIQECKGGYWSAPSPGKCESLGGTASPVASPITGSGCVGNNCTSPAGGCIAVHHCDQLQSNGECTVLNPDVRTGTVNAQEEANQTCKCVQVDVLNGENGSCVNGHINEDWTTLIGAAVVCPDSSANCSPSSPNPSPDTSPDPSPVTYFCNSDCTTNRQCKTADNNYFCSEGKCRLNTNPDSAKCRPISGPMCLNISMINALDSSTKITEDPKYGDVVKFACAQVEGITKYVFRVIEPDGVIKNLEATGRASEPYTIEKSGKFYAQCQICTENDPLSCHAFESLE